jgi:hypothetical protein
MRWMVDAWSMDWASSNTDIEDGMPGDYIHLHLTSSLCRSMSAASWQEQLLTV